MLDAFADTECVSCFLGWTLFLHDWKIVFEVTDLQNVRIEASIRRFQYRFFFGGYLLSLTLRSMPASKIPSAALIALS